ncbi:MAG: hypothetical protein AAFY57_15520 [Cyanobacteria bacterium J06642_2]
MTVRSYCCNLLKVGILGAAISTAWGTSSLQARELHVQAPESDRIDERTVLVACEAGTVTTDLPNPFIDLLPTDWAYEAVLKMYYCGPYRGAIPPEQLLQFREAQRAPST